MSGAGARSGSGNQPAPATWRSAKDAKSDFFMVIPDASPPPACVLRNGEGYRIEFESWSSDLGVEEQSSESRQIVLTSAP